MIMFVSCAGRLPLAGRSRAFINDSPVTLDLLSHVAMLLVDIHSQHNNRLLASPEFQLSIIDTLAGNEQLLADYCGALSPIGAH